MSEPAQATGNGANPVAAPPETLPLARPVLGEREEQLVLEVLRSGRLSLGPMLERFERDFAEWLGVGEAVAVSSGTAALHLGVRARGWGRGDEVITSPFSFVASANCLLYEDVRPVFCDVDPFSLNLDPVAAEAAVGPATAGILPVHIFGYPAAMPQFRRLSDRHGLGLLEDACEALGAVDAEGGRVGAGGGLATFAFYANKQMTTGEGGMITTGDAELARLLRSGRNQGRAIDMGWLDHERLGFNYRLSDIACAIGIGQLERLDEMLAGRARAAEMYEERLAGVEAVVTPAAGRDRERRSWFVYVIKLVDDDERSEKPSEFHSFSERSNEVARSRRDEVITALAAEGIPAKEYLPCIHLMPHYRALGYRPGQFPAAEAASARSLALPLFPGMSEEQVERVCSALKRALRA